MALQATLSIEGKRYNVQDLNFKLTQATDHVGKPTAITQGGMIDFTILANKKDDCFFQKWVLSVADVHGGIFYLPITDGINHSEMTIVFRDAYCTDLQFWYGSYNDKQVYMKIQITPAKLEFGPGTEYINKKVEKPE